MNINFEKVKSSIQSIGNSLVVAGLIASVFKGTVPYSVFIPIIIIGFGLIVFSTLEDKE